MRTVLGGGDITAALVRALPDASPRCAATAGNRVAIRVSQARPSRHSFGRESVGSWSSRVERVYRSEASYTPRIDFRHFAVFVFVRLDIDLFFSFPLSLILLVSVAT